MDLPTAGPPERDENAGTPTGVPDAPPTLPSRTAFLLAFLSIVAAGLFGGIIGYGLGDISAGGDGGLEPLLWAVVGAIIAAGGVGVVAVLVLRAQAEWRRIPPPEPPHGEPGPAEDDPGWADDPDDPDDAGTSDANDGSPAT